MTSAQSIRPTTDVSTVILDSLDDMVARVLARADGLSVAEYLWEPATPAWTVRPEAGAPSGSRRGLVDTSEDRDIDPAPFTTIAWRLWHLAVDCFDDYARRLGGVDDDIEPDRAWFLEPEPALDALQSSWVAYRRALVDRGDFWNELGEAWGPWSRHCIGDMAIHASNELVHHGAEIALLRDLYLHRSTD